MREQAPRAYSAAPLASSDSDKEMLEAVSRRVQGLRESWAKLLSDFDDDLERGVVLTVRALVSCFLTGGKLLVAGNGGSAAEAQHLVGELVGRFRFDRPPLAAIALHADSSALTSIANDYSFDDVYARQVRALGSKGDVFLGISTSGESHNVVRAAWAARNLGMTTIGYLSRRRGALAEAVDIPLVIPSTDTPLAQEGHMLLTHLICGLIEDTMFARGT